MAPSDATPTPSHQPSNDTEFKTQSDTISKISLALSKAQSKMTAAKRTAENPFFKSKYADLSSVWDSIRTPLSEHELAVVQTPIEDEKGTAIITTLAHSSGEWFRSKLYISPKAKDAQSIGSAITYARRYALSAITGIAPDDDDDGNQAVGQNGKAATAEKKTYVPKPTPPPVAKPAEEPMARPTPAAPPADIPPPTFVPMQFPPPQKNVPRSIVETFLEGVTVNTAKTGSTYYKIKAIEGESWTTFSTTVAEHAKHYANQGVQVAVALDMQPRGAIAVGVRPAQ